MKITRTIQIVAAAIVLLFTGIAAATGRCAEKGEKAQTKAPDAVMIAFHKAYPKATIRDVSQENKDGATYYEVESLDGAQRRDLLYFADGAVYEIEEAMNLGDLPKQITDTLTAKFPQAKLQKAERITRGSIVQYEVSLESGEDNLEVLLDSHGVIKSKASVGDEDEQADADESDEADED